MSKFLPRKRYFYLPSVIIRVLKTGFLATWNKYGLKLTLQNILPLSAITSGFRNKNVILYRVMYIYSEEKV